MKFHNLVESKETLETVFTDLLVSGKLIPVLGAGFTYGCTAASGKVLNGDELRSEMLSRIKYGIKRDHYIANPKQFESLAKSDLKSISKRFFSTDYVEPTCVEEIVSSHFTEVNISENGKKFLDFNWPDVYTLNIDDGIEKCGYSPVLPNRQLKETSRNTKRVYKLHGDAIDIIQYKENNGIIFSSDQYLSSIETNKHLLTYLQSDLENKNIIFIGCSLDDELDIIHAAARARQSTATRRFYITTKSEGDLDSIKLEDHGITDIITTQDYNSFYRFFNGILAMVSLTGQGYNSKSIKILMEEELTCNIRMMVGGTPFKKNDDDEYVIPGYTIERAQKKKLLESYAEDDLIVVQGKRFSGKTLFALDIARSIHDKKVAFFASNIELDTQTVKRALSQQNTLSIFDTGSIDADCALIIRDLRKTISENQSKVIVICNDSDFEILPILTRSYSSESVQISNSFTSDEFNRIDDMLLRCGMVASEKKGNLLNMTYHMHRHYPSNSTERLGCAIDDDESVKAAIVLAVNNIAYQADLRLYCNTDISDVCNNLTPIVEKMQTERSESRHHSPLKVKLTSLPWIIKSISSTLTKRNADFFVQSIVEIIKSLKKDSITSGIAKKLIIFDNLNMLFSSSHSGSAFIIMPLYKELRQLLHKDPNYWLQRSKAALQMSKEIKEIADCIESIKIAINSENASTKINAIHTRAQLLGRYCSDDGYKSKEKIEEAVIAYSDALAQHLDNKEHVTAMVNDYRRGKGNLYLLLEKISEKGLVLSTNASRNLSFVKSILA